MVPPDNATDTSFTGDDEGRRTKIIQNFLNGMNFDGKTMDFIVLVTGSPSLLSGVFSLTALYPDWINTFKCLAQNVKSGIFTKHLFNQAFKQNKSRFRHNKETQWFKCKTIQLEVP